MVSKCACRCQAGDRGGVIAKVSEDGLMIAVKHGAGAVLRLEAAQGERRAQRTDLAEGGVRIGGEHMTLCQLVPSQRTTQRAHRCAWNAAAQPLQPRCSCVLLEAWAEYGDKRHSVLAAGRE